jgi:hypothetical protein
MEKRIDCPNFIEVSSVEDANKVDLSLYTFCERLEASRGTFVFKVRQK